MRVQVRFTTQLKSALGTASDSVEIGSPATLGKLYERLIERHGPVFRQLVLDGTGRPLPSILVCVGDTQVEPAPETGLRDGDEVTILSAISGG